MMGLPPGTKVVKDKRRKPPKHKGKVYDEYGVLGSFRLKGTI